MSNNPAKSADAFRTISEVAEELGLPQHVLRFWETRFSQIKPMKRGGGRRYYRPDDLALLAGIQFLLYDEGYTIKGVQRLLKDNGNKYVVAAGRGEDLSVFTDNRDIAEPGVQPVGDIESAKHAVPVADIISCSDNKEKSQGILSRIKGASADKPAHSGERLNLSSDDRKLLQATLYDLLECKRLLDQAR